MKKTIFTVSALGAVLLLGACGGNAKKETADRTVVPAIDLTAMDTTIRPQDDFYMYANGNWIKNNPLKPAYSRFGSFDILRDTSTARIHQIVENLAKSDFSKGTDEYRIAVLYRQAMDSTTRNQLGAKPIMDHLKELSELKDKVEIIKYAADRDNEGYGTLFGSYVYADAKNSDLNVLHISQTGLSLGNRDYYVQKTPENESILKDYTAYIEKIVKMAGYDDAMAKRVAENNLKVQKQLAQFSYSSQELRDTYRNYNMLKLSELIDKQADFDWKLYFDERELKLDSLNVAQLDFFKEFAVWYKEVGIEELKDWLLASYIDDNTGFLSDDFAQASFDFYSKRLRGQEEMKPRWERSVGLVEGILGQALGKVYVEKYFSPEAKQRMLDLVGNLQVALKERIESLTWMTGATKEKALEKLAAFVVKIGYPDTWRDFSSMDIDAGKSYIENLKAAKAYWQEDNIKRLGQKVDRDEWLMNPQTVNAYYNPSTNEICFPAGILQPPFFNVDADDAVNYGAIGVVIGHEMTHGFDDQGRNFDKKGDLNNWWTDEDSKKFEESTKVLVNQFNQIIVADDVHADGALTLGENIADQGGLLISYAALQNALKGKEIEPIDGFTPAQRFYIAYARIWGQNIRKEEILRLTKLDVHSLGMWRVNATLRNVEDFYKAFNIQPEDKMYLAPEERVVIW